MKISLTNPSVIVAAYDKLLKERDVSATRLKQNELSQYPKIFAAWRTVLHDSRVETIICLSKEAPFVAPAFFLDDKSKFREWPHVEENGKLCLMQDDARIFHTPSDQIDLLQALITRAEELIEEGTSGKTKHEFVEEIRSYWPNSPVFTSLCDVEPKETKTIYYFSGRTNSNQIRIFFESEKKGRNWFNNSGLSLSDLSKPSKTVMFVLEKTPLPADYPVSGAGLIDFINNHSSFSRPEILNWLIDCVPEQDPKKFPILFLVDTGATGIAILEIMVERRPTITNRRLQIKENPYHTLKKEDQLKWYLTTDSKIERRNSSRINSEWLYKRGGTEASIVLKDKKICIIGCGSLGSGIAELLTKAGISKLILIDHDTLGWENIARHSLGALQTKENKALSLANKLRNHFPFSEISAYKTRWQDLSDQEFRDIATCDLIISATAEWSSDDHLNKLFKLNFRSFPSVLFTWLEPYALAGQAILINRLGSCFQCVIDEDLKFINRVIEPNPNQPIKTTDTACGGASSPYGAIEMSFTQTMATELAIDYLSGKVDVSTNKTWVGDLNKIKERDLALNKAWNEKIEIQNCAGSRIFCEEMPVNKNCPLCKPQH